MKLKKKLKNLVEHHHMWTSSKQMSELEASQKHWPFWNPTKTKLMRNVQKVRSSN